jgi:hypothetical protein
MPFFPEVVGSFEFPQAYCGLDEHTLEDGMAKLFALEATDVDPLDKRNELLIDKVLEYDKKTKSGTSVTADLLKQRHDLRKQITDELNEQKQDDDADDNNEDSSGSDSDSDGSDSDAGDGGGSKGGSADADTSADDREESGDSADRDGDKDADKPVDKAEDKPTDRPQAQDGESEESAAADDVDNLRDLVGGGSGKGGDKKQATESLWIAPAARKRPSAVWSVVGLQSALRNLFQPLKDSHSRRMVSLESFQLKDKPKVTDQPLVYVADQVMESLNRLIALANQYLQKNQSTITQGAAGLKELGDKLTVYREYVQAQKFHFSQALIQDKDLLEALSIKDKNELAYTSTLLAKYLESSSALAVKLLQNPFEQIPDALVAAGYTADEKGVFVNPQVMPGFNTMQASVAPFSNYIDADYEEYQVYKVLVLKPQDLYSLPALSLDQDKDLKKLLTELDKILVSSGLILDNLKTVGDSYQRFIEAAKGIVYDVEKGTQTNLAGLGLNEKLKDFIKFKLVTELYLNDYDAAVHYLSAALSALAHLVELSDK